MLLASCAEQLRRQEGIAEKVGKSKWHGGEGTGEWVG